MMRDGAPTFPGGAVPRGGFLVHLIDELDGLRVLGLYSGHSKRTRARGLHRSLQKSKRHEVFATIAHTHFIEGCVVARLESPSALLEELDDGSEGSVLQHNSRHDILRID